MVSKKAIKEAIQARLLGQTQAENRVYVDRIGPLQETQLPGIVIFVTSEEISEVNNLEDRQTLRIAIEIQAKEASGTSDFDTISDQVYHTFRNDEYLADGDGEGLVERFRYTRGELLFDPQRHVDGGAWVMEYVCTQIVDSTPDLEVANPADLDLIYSEQQAGQAPDPADNPILGSFIEIEQD